MLWDIKGTWGQIRKLSAVGVARHPYDGTQAVSFMDAPATIHVLSDSQSARIVGEETLDRVNQVGSIVESLLVLTTVLNGSAGETRPFRIGLTLFVVLVILGLKPTSGNP